MKPYNVIVDKIWEERVTKFGIHKDLFYPEKDFSEMTNEELRSYATLFREVDRYGGNRIRKDCIGCKLIDAEASIWIGRGLSEEFAKRAGEDFMTIYRYLNFITGGDEDANGLSWQRLAYNGSLEVYEVLIERAAGVLDYCRSQNISVEQCIAIYRLAWKEYPSLGISATMKQVESDNKFIDKLLSPEDNSGSSKDNKSALMNFFK